MPTDEQREQWLHCFNQLQELSTDLRLGDVFNYNRGREIHTAFKLGLTISDTLAGADAYENNKPVELKSTIGALKGVYNGVSVQPTWDEQVDYLINKKIGCYHHHYITRYDNGVLCEVYRLTGDDVLALTLPKFNKQFHSTNARKDPRLSATINAKEIKLVGERVIF